MEKVEAGVIQGSVLGPVLFLLFIADINNYMPAGVSFEKYADDIIAYIIGEAIRSDLPQKVAEAVEKWCADNGMRLNVGKCKVMHSCTRTPKLSKSKPSNSSKSVKRLSSKPRAINKPSPTKSSTCLPTITLGQAALEPVSVYKYLGFHVNPSFDASVQWDNIRP